MSKRLSKAASLELAFLAALHSIHADVDTSEIGEIQDWSRAVRGKLYGAAVKDASDLSKWSPNAIAEPSPSSRPVSGAALGASSNMARHGSVQYSQMAIPQLIAVCTSEPSTEAFYEFVLRSNPLINRAVARALRRSGKFSHELVDDLCQDVYLKLCSNNFRALTTFKFNHENAFLGFLKVMATHTVQDYFRSAASSKRDAHEQEAPKADRVFREHASSRDASPQPERKVFLEKIDAILKTHAHEPNFNRDYKIFWLYFREGLTAKEIAASRGVELGVKGVESTLLRLTRQMRVALKLENARTT